MYFHGHAVFEEFLKHTQIIYTLHIPPIRSKIYFRTAAMEIRKCDGGEQGAYYKKTMKVRKIKSDF